MNSLGRWRSWARSAFVEISAGVIPAPCGWNTSALSGTSPALPSTSPSYHWSRPVFFFGTRIIVAPWPTKSGGDGGRWYVRIYIMTIAYSYTDTLYTYPFSVLFSICMLCAVSRYLMWAFSFAVRMFLVRRTVHTAIWTSTCTRNWFRPTRLDWYISCPTTRIERRVGRSTTRARCVVNWSNTWPTN